ncbi:MAG: hypothetical protein HGGPFJEG_01230 [Ignavibacteria bacterium]|nr:hypothetical protein [Ignavibacteria bacterium]
MKRSNRYFILTIGILIIFGSSFLPSVEFLLNFANDDSFFYIKTAYNFSAGFGSSFDTINLTNGYHPLWFLILSFYFFILNIFTKFSPELYYRFTVLLISSINLLTVYFLYKYFRIVNPLNYKKSFILAVPLFLTFVAIRDFGMETHLLCLLITIYLFVKSKELTSDMNYVFVKTILLVLLFLTRIDFLFNAIPVIIAADYLTCQNESRSKFVLYGVIMLIIASSLYFFSNYIFFGHISTISAAIKNSYPEIILISNIRDLFAPGTFTNQFVKTFFAFSTVLLFLFLITLNKFKKKFLKSDFFLWGLCISSLTFLLSNLAVNFHALKEWYVAYPAFVCALLSVRLLFQLPRLFPYALIIFTSVFVFYFVRTRIENYKWDSMYYFALDIKKSTNVNDRIFMIDLSGITGYFSERNLINGDGLINNFEYWDYKSKGRLEEYLRMKDIKYYATYSTEKGNHLMKEESGYLNDFCYQNINFGGYHFRFPIEDLILKSDYFYSHAVNSDKGYWYLFKLK